MKRLIATLAVALVAGAGWLAMSGMPVHDENEVVVAMAGELAPEGVYELRSNERRETCAVTRGDEVAEGRSELTVEPSCAAVLPGVERARYWLETDDGAVAFTENGVDPIITFGIADGVAYESLDTGQPMISLDVRFEDKDK